MTTRLTRQWGRICTRRPTPPFRPLKRAYVSLLATAKRIGVERVSLGEKSGGESRERAGERERGARGQAGGNAVAQLHPRVVLRRSCPPSLYCPVPSPPALPFLSRRFRRKRVFAEGSGGRFPPADAFCSAISTFALRGARENEGKGRKSFGIETQYGAFPIKVRP